ncbi:MAG: hypothetical protein KC877_05290 [Candidatus Kaiserbacteria bacterium]|nr:hypothetical protein [Candidatus Kaiserbacteria bacterium]MCB9816093.1 hypothetical protein [Candidatus Nomurabacteria bacterium]
MAKTRDWERPARNRLFHQLYLEYQETLINNKYLHVDAATHETVRFLFGGDTITFIRQYGYVRQTTFGERELEFLEWSFLRLLAEELMEAVWAGYRPERRGKRRRIHLVTLTGDDDTDHAAECAYVRLLQVSRVKTIFLVGGDEVTYVRDRGFTDETLRFARGLDRSNEHFYSTLATELMEAVTRGHDETKLNRKPKPRKKRFRHSVPIQGKLFL